MAHLRSGRRARYVRTLGELDLGILIKETQRRQYEGHNTHEGHHTDLGPRVCDQYDTEGGIVA